MAFFAGKNDRGFYFDSFGFPPIIEKHWSAIRNNCTVLEWNSHQLQSEKSKVCGHYCIMFLHFMSYGIDFDRFRSIFGTNFTVNDEIVTEFYNSYTNKSVNTPQNNYYCIQECCIRNYDYNNKNIYSCYT